MRVSDWIPFKLKEADLGFYFSTEPIKDKSKIVEITPEMESWEVVKLYRSIDLKTPMISVTLIRK